MSGLLLTGTSNTGLVERDLATAVRRGGPWEPNEVAGFAVLVAHRLDELHALGRVADGLDPGRLVLTSDGAVTIVTAGAGQPTHDPRFRAPEWLPGRELSASADWYALGCVLHVLLTLTVPVGYDTAGGWSARVLQNRPDTGATLARLVGALLSEDPRERPASARDVEALLVVPTGLPQATTVLPQDVALSRGAARPAGRAWRRRGARFRRLTGFGSAASATVVVLGGAVLLTIGAGDNPQSGRPDAGHPVQAKAVAPSARAKPRPTTTQRPTRSQATPRPTPTSTSTPVAGATIEPVADPVGAEQAARLRTLAALLRSDPRAERSTRLQSAAASLSQAANDVLGNRPTAAASSISSALAMLADAQRAGRWQPTAAQWAQLEPLGYRAVSQGGRTHHDD